MAGNRAGQKGGARRTMNRFCSKLSHLLSAALAVGLLSISAIVVLQVILSSLFNSSITGANEIITKLFVYLTAIGSAVAVDRNEHIAITVTTERMPPQTRRLARGLNLSLVAILNLVVIVYSVHWIDVTGHYLMPTTQLPRILAQLSVPIGSALAVLFCVARLLTLRSEIPGESSQEATES